MEFANWNEAGGDADLELLVQGAGVPREAGLAIVKLWQAERQAGEPLLNFLARARILTADDVRNIEAGQRRLMLEGRSGAVVPMATALRLRKFAEELLRRAPQLSAAVRPASLAAGRAVTPTRGVGEDTIYSAGPAKSRAAAGPTTVVPGYTPQSPPWKPATPPRRLGRDAAPTVAVTTNGPVEPGAYVGRILIERKLGEGGFGAVYEGMHTKLRVRVAVKSLHSLTGDTDDAARQRFLAEARIQAQINHTAIVRIWDLDDQHDPPYLVLEFMDGPSLQQMLETSGRLPVRRSVAMIRRVALGLQAACEAGIVHRDIKPANILTNRSGDVKIGDFGQATLMEDSLRRQLSIRCDPANSVFGTTEYMAPEHAQGMNMDPRSDIYSMGATLFHMLCGRPPFQGKNPFQTVFQAASEPLPDPRQLEPSLDPATVALLQHMLAKKPDERFANYRELLGEMDKMG